MTTDLTLLGLCGGLGVLLLMTAMRAPRTSLVTEMSRYDPRSMLQGGAGELARAEPRRALVVIGGSLDRLVTSTARRSRRAQDLAVTDRTLEGHVIAIATATLAGISVPVVCAGLVSFLGWHVSIAALFLVAGIGGATGMASPALELSRSANRTRERFLRGLSSWLELVALAQAGGMGVEGALHAASWISPDETFSRLGGALERGRRSGTTPWEEMERLGAEIGVEELHELAASLGLAGVEGARIRASLTAKSASLRRRQMSDAQARANSTTERLFLPSIILMTGFMVFLMYPAVVSLANVL